MNDDAVQRRRNQVRDRYLSIQDKLDDLLMEEVAITYTSITGKPMNDRMREKILEALQYE